MKIGINLGTASIAIAIEGRGIIYREPSIMAVNERSGKILAIGDKAREILRKADKGVRPVFPMKDGVIADYEATEILLTHFLKKSSGKIRFFKPLVIISVPAKITSIEERAIKEAAFSAGAKEVFLFPAPVLAAIGADLR